MATKPDTDLLDSLAHEPEAPDFYALLRPVDTEDPSAEDRRLLKKVLKEVPGL